MSFKDFLDIVLFMGTCFLSVSALLIGSFDRFYKLFYEKCLLQPEFIFYWGLGFFVFSILYGLNLYSSSKGTYLSMQMSAGPLEIDKKVLKELIDHTTNKNFSELNMESEVEIVENQIEITAKSDPIDFKKHKKILRKLEKEIGQELSKTLSYKKPFQFNLKMK